MTSNTINDAVTMAGGEGTLLAGRYRIVRQLGQGGMGSVWLAEDTQLDNKPFAIKMLPSILVSNKRAYRQLKDEALVAMKLTHPNIVTLRAFEENNGNPFLVMDYIDGQTLDDYLYEKCKVESVKCKVSGGLSEDEVIRLLKPIAAALDYAHGEGVVHRDVKPANVMIRNDGHPFILDFGIAREMQETMTRVTGKLSSGTLLYMSPEQLRGLPPKPAQDVYSFAAMAYECLKGEPPFSRGQIEYQILNETPAPLPGESRVSASVMRGLSKSPEGRPNSCVKVLFAALPTRQPPPVRVQTILPPRRMSPPTVARQPDPITRNTLGIVIPLVCILVALATIVGVVCFRNVWRREAPKSRSDATWQPKEAPRQDAVTEPKPEMPDRTKAQEEKVAQDEKTAKNEKAAKEDKVAQQRDAVEGPAVKASANDDKLSKAESSRRQAQNAFKDAEALGARTHAKDKWEKARKAWRQATDAFSKAKFEDAKASFDNASGLFKQSGQVAQTVMDALDVIARDPLKYESVIDDLDMDKRKVLSSAFQDVKQVKMGYDALLGSYTENHPEVVAKRKALYKKCVDFRRRVIVVSAYIKCTKGNSNQWYYNVRAGDSLTSISKAFGMEVKDLKALNGLRGDVADVGQSLEVSNVSLSLDREHDDMLASIKAGSVINLVTVDSVSKSGVVTKNRFKTIGIRFVKGKLTIEAEYPYSAIKDVSVMPAEKFYTGRTPASIGAATRGGASYGDAATEACVMKVLWWLKAHQNADGSWGMTNKVADTAFAVLTYLAHGEYPASPSPYKRDFGPVVQRALDYLVSRVKQDGTKVTISGADKNEYAFLIATYALCEAYGVTKNSNCKDAACACLDRIVRGQSLTGGWDYKINPLSTRDDLSFAGWALQALKAGKMSGLHPEGLDECIQKAVRCLKTRNFKNGGFAYTSVGNPTGLTATGCLAMQLFGHGNAPEVQSALDFMREWRPAFDKDDFCGKSVGACPQYYCYYATQCKYLAGMKAGAMKNDEIAWQQWNLAMKKLYPASIIDHPEKVQDCTGKMHKQGYFENKDAHTSRPVMDSCLVALQLMVYYRYPPNLGM